MWTRERNRERSRPDHVLEMSEFIRAALNIRETYRFVSFTLRRVFSSFLVKTRCVATSDHTRHVRDQEDTARDRFVISQIILEFLILCEENNFLQQHFNFTELRTLDKKFELCVKSYIYVI